MKKTSNLEAYVNWFNRLSYLVTTEICSVSINMSQIRSMLCFHSKYKNEKMWYDCLWDNSPPEPNDVEVTVGHCTAFKHEQNHYHIISYKRPLNNK